MRILEQLDQHKSKEGGAPVRCYLAEFVGTFVLTFADAGVGVASELSPGIPLMARAIAPALTVLALIFALGEVSGAHLNPAVTFAFALRGVFPWKKVAGYWVTQLTAAVCAALVLRATFGLIGNVGATEPVLGAGVAFQWEIILTSILVFVILATAHQSKIKGPEAAFPVAAAIAVCGLAGKGISGASMNPARSFGPALISGTMNTYWIYAIAPLIGAALATGLVRVIHGPPKEKDEEAAKGEKNVRGK